MNRKIMMAIGAMAIAAVLGLIFSQTLSVSADPDLNEEEISEKVRAQYPGEITALKLNDSGSKPVYEVEIDLDGKLYILSIDGNSGQVIQLEEKRMLAQQAEIKDTGQDAEEEEEKNQLSKEKIEREDEEETKTTKNGDNEKQSDQKSKEETSTSSETTEKQSAERSIISTDKAIEIALEQFPGTIYEIELDTEDGRLIYEIEIESPRGEAEIEIDAYTGEVLVVDIDLDD